jgi:RecQ family ATP-dependent DNA helicase
MPKANRYSIVQEIQRIPGLQTERDELNRLVFPSPSDPPIPVLQPPRTDGLKCQERNSQGVPCHYIACQVQNMQKHYRIEHKWVNGAKTGRPRKSRVVAVPWRSGVHCQHFFVRGPGAQYFEVAPQAGPQPIPSGDSGFAAAKQELAAALERANEEERRRVTEAEESREPNPWLRRVGWASHLAGLDRQEVRKLVGDAGADEPDLEVMCRGFDWMIQDAQFNAVKEVVGLHALFEANKKEVDKKPSMPFESWMDITTVKKYTKVWKALLCYVFRAEDQPPETRPAYRLTDAQDGALDRVRQKIHRFRIWRDEQPDRGGGVESEEEVRRMKQIQRMVLQLCIAMLDQPLQDDEYKSVVISGMAVLGMRDGEGWLDAEDYTPTYSAAIKLARLMVVQEAYHRRQKEIDEWKAGGSTADQAGEAATSYYRLTRGLVKSFMTMAHGDRDPTPMHWLYDSRSYGFKIRYTNTSAGRIQWIGDTVMYPDVQFDMDDVRTMVHGLVGEAKEELFPKLMMVGLSDEGEVDATVPAIPWDRIIDQPSEARVGWSFLDDSRNQWPACKEWWMFQRMYEEPTVRGAFLDAAGTLKASAVAGYRRHVTRFKELLLILMQICGGQPSRAPELLGMRWKNTEYGGIRNIFIEEGLVAFVASYHKGYRSSGNIKVVHRYLPREVGELLVYYLWLVLPFWEKLQFQVSGCRSGSPFLWGNGQKKEHRQWTGPKRSRPGERVHPEDQTPGTVPGGSTPSQPPPPERTRQAEQLMAQRQDGGWTSERVRKIMQESSERWMGARVNISAWRHIAIAISRKYCRDDRFEEEKARLEDGEWDEDNADGDDIWDLQCGHGTHTAGMVYARELMEGDQSILSRRERFRRVSHVWHCWLNFPSAHAGVGMGGRLKRKRAAYEEEMQDAQVVRWKRLRGVDIHAELEQMYGDGAGFRGLQEPALRAIMKNKSPIVVVMGTGAGKSLLFMLPARSVGAGTTVVITPLISLQEDLAGRCRRAGIPCTRWDSRKAQTQAHSPTRIVIVTPEAAVGATFSTFLNRLQGIHQLDRIVVDECHTVLDSTARFRPQLRELGQMARRRVQMVYLTATLPPRDEAEFTEIMKVDVPAEHVFRAATSRPNIEYRGFEYEGDEEEATCRMVQEKLEEFPAPAKMIVYSSSVATTQALSQALQCHAYYRDVGDRKQKEQIRTEWQSADGRVVIATNAFGLGIDEPNVRCVIHVGTIYRLRSFAQESGRAGRDGARSQSIIMMPQGMAESLQKVRPRPISRVRGGRQTESEKRMAEAEKVQRFMSGARCRRVYLDEEMDGRRDRIGCEDGEEACDVCVGALAKVAQQDEVGDGEVDMSSSRIQSGPAEVQRPGRHSRPRASGETVEPVSQQDRDEFQAQAEQREQQKARIDNRVKDEGHDSWDLENQLDRWVDRCPICQVRNCSGQRVDTRHTLDECTDEQHDAVVAQVKILEGLRFERFSCCTRCAVPQKVCAHWQEVAEGRQRFREAGAVPCQYDKVVRPAVAAMVVVGPGFDNQVAQWMAADGILKGVAGVNEAEVMEIRKATLKWLQMRVMWGGMESSVFIKVFYHLSRSLVG